MFSKWQRAMDDQAADINVVPVMNLFMVLIPFLLMGAAFYQIGVIPTSTPQHSPHESDVPKTPTTVSANLMLEPDTMRITFASTNLSEDELAALAATWPRGAKGKYDVEGLQQKLVEIKKLYPESTTITILPHDDLGYQELVEVLDRLREHQVGFDKDGNPTYKELFPVTVFSRLLRADPEEEDEASDEGEGGEE